MKTAIEHLAKQEKGYYLMVKAGRADQPIQACRPLPDEMLSTATAATDCKLPGFTTRSNLPEKSIWTAATVYRLPVLNIRQPIAPG